jgi:hypothetical protein
MCGAAMELVVIVSLLLASSWAFLASSMTLEEFAIKELNVRRLADDALQLAEDTEDCGKNYEFAPLTSQDSHFPTNFLMSVMLI